MHNKQNASYLSFKAPFIPEETILLMIYSSNVNLHCYDHICVSMQLLLDVNHFHKWIVKYNGLRNDAHGINLEV